MNCPWSQEKRAEIFQAERGAEPGVVAKLGMRVERQVRTVNRQIIFQQQPQQFVFFARPRMRRAPEQSVMHDHQVRLRRDGQLHRRQAGIHRRRDARDHAAIFDLQTIRCTVVVFDFIRAQQTVAVLDDGGERDFRHGTMKSKLCPRAKGENCSVAHWESTLCLSGVRRVIHCRRTGRCH